MLGSLFYHKNEDHPTLRPLLEYEFHQSKKKIVNSHIS